MTNQEAFNLVWDWFVVQKNQPSFEDGACSYRGPNGAKCAAGVLIHDDKYTVEIEGNVCTEWEVARTLPPGLSPDFVRRMQQAHDLNAIRDDFHDRFEERMCVVASAYKLTIPETVTA